MTETKPDEAAAWSEVAGAWDTFVDYVDEHSAAATGTMIDRMELRPGDRVLELAAGPGTLGPLLSERVGPTGHVVISDLAPRMVEVARRRNADRANVSCAVLDATAIDRVDGEFDAVVSRMGLMFAPDPSVALGEIHRVLAPGGRLGAMTWAGMEHNPWMTCVGMAAMLAGIVTEGPPIGAGGIFSLGDPDHVGRLVAAAGFDAVIVDVADVVFRAPDVPTHVSRVGALAGPLAARIAAATPDQRESMERSAVDLAEPYRTDDGFVFPGRAVVATARR